MFRCEYTKISVVHSKYAAATRPRGSCLKHINKEIAGVQPNAIHFFGGVFCISFSESVNKETGIRCWNLSWIKSSGTFKIIRELAWTDPNNRVVFNGQLHECFQSIALRILELDDHGHRRLVAFVCKGSEYVLYLYGVKETAAFVHWKNVKIIHKSIKSSLNTLAFENDPLTHYATFISIIIFSILRILITNQFHIFHAIILHKSIFAISENRSVNFRKVFIHHWVPSILVFD